MALYGCGCGLFQSPNNRMLMAEAPRERSGDASGMLKTARLIGRKRFGAALIALIFNVTGPHKTTLTRSVADAFSIVAAGASLVRPRVVYPSRLV